ncbi:MAG: hypothetical protein CMJ18_14040 [Phycisphaeraceae bacterium]|nr:hypothetical protein [Phycisphaeraceae bacterium]
MNAPDSGTDRAADEAPSAAPTTSFATSSAPSSSVGSTGDVGRSRERFGSAELAIVLSRYDLGEIESIKEFPRGSRKAPKLIIRCENGKFLLKRRAGGRDDPYKVAFAHEIQLALSRQQFPLPRLIGTRRDNNSMLERNGAIYELFEYISGTGYDNSLQATGEAGRILALFHKLLREFRSEYKPQVGSYHASKSVQRSMKIAPQTLGRIDRDGRNADEIQALVRSLDTSYRAAASRVVEAGLDEWPTQIVHCDWHPGNMLFRGDRVVAVIDYDSARIQQRITDVANGALQFSILGGGEDPAEWPDYVDVTRFRRFLATYESVPECIVSKAEIEAIPWLMIEALIAESVIPIANTGTFARLEGFSFMRMVERKVQWIETHADELIAAAAQ